MTRRFWMFATVLAVCGSSCLPRILPAQPSAVTARLVATAATGAASPQNPASQARLRAEYGKLPLAFEANQGQTDGEVKFLSRGAGYTLFLTGGGAVVDLKQGPGVRGWGLGNSGQSAVVSRQLGRDPRADSRHNDPRSTNYDRRATDHGQRTTDSVLTMRLAGANANAPVSGVGELPGKSNYFIGNDPKKWRTNVANYAKVRYRNVYPGIDLVYYGNQGGRLEYDFVVAPGADPSAIKLDVGAALVAVHAGHPARETSHGRAAARKSGHPQGVPLHVDRNGDLIVKIDGGEVRFNKPVIYQLDGISYAGGSPLVTRHSPLVNGRYRLRHHQVTFEVAKYDRTRPLVIDPERVTVTNKGDSAVSIAGISISGNNAGDFAQTNNCGSGLASGASCFVTVTFTPSAKGKRTADVSITDNGGGSPQSASLSGTGT